MFSDKRRQPTHVVWQRGQANKTLDKEDPRMYPHAKEEMLKLDRLALYVFTGNDPESKNVQQWNSNTKPGLASRDTYLSSNTVVR